MPVFSAQEALLAIGACTSAARYCYRNGILEFCALRLVAACHTNKSALACVIHTSTHPHIRTPTHTHIHPSIHPSTHPPTMLYNPSDEPTHIWKCFIAILPTFSLPVTLPPCPTSPAASTHTVCPHEPHANRQLALSLLSQASTCYQSSRPSRLSARIPSLFPHLHSHAPSHSSKHLRPHAERERVTVANVASTMAALMASNPLARVLDLASFRLLSCGGSPQPPAVVRRCVAVFGCENSMNLGLLWASTIDSEFQEQRRPTHSHVLLRFGFLNGSQRLQADANSCSASVRPPWSEAVCLLPSVLAHLQSVAGRSPCRSSQTRGGKRVQRMWRRSTPAVPALPPQRAIAQSGAH
eukprot:365362-Chlamydomonas_euryale.AAC.4